MTTTSVTEGSLRLDRPPRLRLVKPAGPSRAATGATPGTDALTAALATDLDGSFERVVRAFQDRLFSFALRLTGNREDAEEVAQDAFVRAYRALAAYPEDRIRALVLQAWLYRITLNVARNKRRGKKVRTVSIDAGDDDDATRRAWEPADDPASRPDARLERREERRGIASLVSSLPEKYKSVLVLRYVENLKLEEVAEILDQPLGTVKSNVHRAVNLLRRAISESRRPKR